MDRRVMILGATALCGLGSGTVAQVSLSDRLDVDRPPLVIAHRTASMGGAPENSLAWIRRGIARGVDMLNVNVQLTSDGHYVLMHDPTLNRTTDVERVYPDGPPNGPTRAARWGKDYVRDYTLDQIGRLRLADGKGGFVEPVPTLEDALSLAEGRILLALGLKVYEVESLSAVLARFETSNVMLFELYVSGTDQAQLRDLVAETGLPLSAVLYQSRDYAADLDRLLAQFPDRLTMVVARRGGLSEAFIEQARAARLTLAISGWASGEDFALVEHGDPAPWSGVLDRGLSALTAQPDALLKLLGR